MSTTTIKEPENPPANHADCSSAFAEIADDATAMEDTLTLLGTDVRRRVLRVRRHSERPIRELVLCHRRCNQNPTEDMRQLVRVHSMALMVRSFSGESCKEGVYVGNNIWGRGFEKRSTYCPCCGYIMDGPEISHVEIVRSGVEGWDRLMVEQCEMGANWYEGKNVGITYEMVDA